MLGGLVVCSSFRSNCPAAAAVDERVNKSDRVSVAAELIATQMTAFPCD